jgi:hypothetical protein
MKRKVFGIATLSLLLIFFLVVLSLSGRYRNNADLAELKLAGLTARYPSDWTASQQANCWEGVGSDHNCMVFQKSNYKLIIIVEPVSESSELGGGILTRLDFENSTQISVDGNDVLRPFVDNGFDESGELLIIPMFITSWYQSDSNYLGEYSHYYLSNNKKYTLLYTGLSPRDLQRSPIIDSMDDIVESLRWDKV